MITALASVPVRTPGGLSPDETPGAIKQAKHNLEIQL